MMNFTFNCSSSVLDFAQEECTTIHYKDDILLIYGSYYLTIPIIVSVLQMFQLCMVIDIQLEESSRMSQELTRNVIELLTQQCYFYGHKMVEF